MHHRWAGTKTGGDVQQPRRFGLAFGEDDFSVGTEGNGQYRAFMLEWLAYRSSSYCVPESGRTVLTPSNDRLTVGTKGNAGDRSRWEKTPLTSGEWYRQKDRFARARCCQAPSSAFGHTARSRPARAGHG